MTSRLANRIRRLEVVLTPEPWVMPDSLRATIDRIFDHMREETGEEPTPESIMRYSFRAAPRETAAEGGTH